MIRETSSLCTAYIVTLEDEELARKLGAQVIVSPKKGDITLIDNIEDLSNIKETKNPIGIIMTVRSKDDEEKIIKAANASINYLIIKFLDWKVIPLENLIK